jgi:hypothetical protein
MDVLRCGKRAIQQWVEADEAGLHTVPRRLTQCWADGRRALVSRLK